MKEERKARIIGLYLTGLMVREEARDALSVSERHFWRLVKRIKEKVPLGLAHGNRGASCTLVSAIDDATKRIIYARFEPHETTASYLLMFRTLAEQRIAPLLVYADRHSIFYLNREPTVEEQLKDIIPRTQVGRALDELHIQYIAALKPQAKGRVERSFRTMQDRFVCELRLANVSTIAQANLLLPRLINDYNKNFSISPSEALPSWFVLPSDFDPDSVFCFKSSRIVKNDNTVSFAGISLQIPPNLHRFSYAKTKVAVHQLLSGEIKISIRTA